MAADAGALRAGGGAGGRHRTAALARPDRYRSRAALARLVERPRPFRRRARRPRAPSQTTLVGLWTLCAVDRGRSRRRGDRRRPAGARVAPPPPRTPLARPRPPGLPRPQFLPRRPPPAS